MQLAPGERSILASFQFTHKAEAAVRALRQAGFHTLQIDRVGEYGREPAPDQLRPAFGAGVQSTQVLFGTEKAGADASGILLAATPEVSGIGGSIDPWEGVLLTAVVPAERLDEALTIIRQHGGNT